LNGDTPFFSISYSSLSKSKEELKAVKNHPVAINQVANASTSLVVLKKIFAVLSLLTLWLTVVVLNFGQAQEVHWGYEGEAGPEHWGELSDMFALCATGKEQSPIDLTTANPSMMDIADAELSYAPSALNILHNGHTVQVNYDKGSYLTLNGTRYELLQFHFHTPSEHAMNGELAGMEIHFVHRSMESEGMLGVLVYESEEDNPAFTAVWENLPTHEREEQTFAATINAADMVPGDHRVYQYMGSLTTPPCSQGVSWNVLSEPITLSRIQLDTLHAILGNNNRPVQPLFERQVVQDTATATQ
jgi:carbonic anhydrase